MPIKSGFNQIYEGMTVLITGHTGFKGSWLAIWLRELGANVIGYSLDAPTQPSNFALGHLADKITHIQGDIRQRSHLHETIQDYKPTAVFHLAAQAIVLDSFDRPQETMETNVVGTLNLLEAIRQAPSVKAAVIVTTDKCYENRDWIWGYREHDALGGKDPYSASKAMAEILTASYRQSYFNAAHSPAIATARAGNVIGGGDFSSHRTIPDTVRALMSRTPVQVRNPSSVRPWFHVLDPLSGYLWLGHALLTQGQKYAQAWNFGPLEYQGVPVKNLVEKMIDLWGHGSWVQSGQKQNKPEMGMLRLNWDKAANELSWQPNYSWVEALQETAAWFKAYEKSTLHPSTTDLYPLCREHIADYHLKARQCGLPWAAGSRETISSFEVKNHEVFAHTP